MLPKPQGCTGCPFYGDGRGYVPDVIRDQAPVAVVFQNPGKDEEAAGVPLCGKTGDVLERDYLKLAGLDRASVSLMNTVRCRLDHQNDLPDPSSVVMRAAIEHCTRAHTRLPEGVKLIVAGGDHAALATTGDSSSTAWRGYVVPYLGTDSYGVHLVEPWVPGPKDLPVLVTVHVARLFRPDSAWLILPTMSDWRKVPRILRGQWPKRPPDFKTEWFNEDPWPSPVAFDTEFTPQGHLIRYSLADGQGRCWVIEDGKHDRALLRIGQGKTTVITQNAWADLPFLRSMVGQDRDFDSYVHVEDTMLMHSVLYSDLPHDLDFLGSIYSSMNRWKHLRGKNELVYSGADAWGTMEVSQALEREFVRDPQSRKVYVEYVRPLIPVIERAQAEGQRTHPARVNEVVSLLASACEDARLQASAAAGWPLNLGSNPQVGQHLYEVEGIEQPRRRGKRRK